MGVPQVPVDTVAAAVVAVAVVAPAAAVDAAAVAVAVEGCSAAAAGVVVGAESAGEGAADKRTRWMERSGRSSVAAGAGGNADDGDARIVGSARSLPASAAGSPTRLPYDDASSAADS